MIDPGSVRFLFALGNPHHERVLKREVERECPGWRPSYQRKGFVTFKLEQGCRWEDLRAHIACARRLCLSLGRFATQGEAFAALAGVVRRHHLVHQDHRLRPRPLEDPRPPGEGELVGTVVSLSDTEHWAGLHRHAPLLSPYPGGDSGIELPPDVPSRAWLKLEEARRFWDLPFLPGQIAVELGSSPGGVAHALLQRGVSVIGVDPADMAGVVRAKEVEDLARLGADPAGFHHCRKPAALVGKRDLGERVDWLLSDMNQTPEVVLDECARLLAMAPTIHSLLLTLKLGDMEQLERKENWIRSLRDLGFSTVRLQQFAVHHRELALLGLR